MKLVVDSETDKVLGAAMCGPDAAEIMQVFFLGFTQITNAGATAQFLKPMTLPSIHIYQGIAIALKCGATKAQFDSTVSHLFDSQQ